MFGFAICDKKEHKNFEVTTTGQRDDNFEYNERVLSCLDCGGLRKDYHRTIGLLTDAKECLQKAEILIDKTNIFSSTSDLREWIRDLNTEINNLSNESAELNIRQGTISNE